VANPVREEEEDTVTKPKGNHLPSLVRKGSKKGRNGRNFWYRIMFRPA